MVMPVGQPGGEYSLFASSSPWSMPLNSSSDSKSMASSPLSSHDSSMRNSPVLGFEPQPSAPYDMAVRHKGMQGEGWMGQGQGHDEQKGRGQATHPGGVPRCVRFAVNGVQQQSVSVPDPMTAAVSSPCGRRQQWP
ncbi:uncharacterized protein LOC143289439 isoform X1 [Babylonia areolata]|uniref:uncharacterized protein LOC143289439 isoform X1 n=1 Tax=Babylonia areolata TaxID=304850 RepID=UPI003FD00C92